MKQKRQAARRESPDRTPVRPLHVDRPTLARVLGVSLRTVANLEAATVVRPVTRGRGGRASRYDLAATVPSYIAHLVAPGSGATLGDARIKMLDSRRRLLDLQHAREAGETITVKAAKAEAFQGARIIREGMKNIPGKIGAALAAESDPHTVFRLLDVAIDQALHETADRLEAEEGERS